MTLAPQISESLAFGSLSTTACFPTTIGGFPVFHAGEPQSPALYRGCTPVLSCNNHADVSIDWESGDAGTLVTDQITTQLGHAPLFEPPLTRTKNIRVFL
ncbi:hypothetical protein HYQ44_017194 [Verticillium longisporum]|nr:hypothetical protein HYQ44_017194 [Verticillium longisporum]